MELIHPAYIDELSEDEAEFRAQIYRGGTTLRATKAHKFPAPSKIRLTLPQSKYAVFAAGVGVGLLTVSVVWLSGGAAKTQPTTMVPPAATPMATEVEAIVVPTKLEEEVELLKRIVAGLVGTVQSLSQVKDQEAMGSESAELFPYPVQVTAEKAHLRKTADRSSPSVLEVTKDTTLMAFDGTDKWLRVSTPRGEEAWISRNVVVAKKG
jgi:hypothetical protein